MNIVKRPNMRKLSRPIEIQWGNAPEANKNKTPAQLSKTEDIDLNTQGNHQKPTIKNKDTQSK